MVIDEAQKTFVVREMMPKDIKREFLTGTMNFDEIMEKLEIIINEMMADDGPVLMDLGNVGTHNARTTQSDLDASNDTSYDDVCAISWKGCKAGQGSGKKDQTEQGRGIEEKGTDEDDGGKKGGNKGFEGSKPDWYGDKDTVSCGNKGQVQDESETRCCCDCGGQGHIVVNCPYKMTNSIAEEDDQGSSWKSEPEVRSQKNLRV